LSIATIASLWERMKKRNILTIDLFVIGKPTKKTDKTNLQERQGEGAEEQQ